MSKLFKIIRQEFKMTAANKAFIIITIIGPFLILAISVLPGLFATSSNNIPEGTQVAIVGGSEDFYNKLAAALEDTNIEAIRGQNPERLEELVLNDELQGFLLLPENYLQAESFTYYSKTGTDMLVSQTLKGVLANIIVSIRLSAEGLEAAKIQRLSREPVLRTQQIREEGEGTGADFFSIFAVAMTFVMLLYMTVLLYGQMIGRSVLTEKTSKTVEIMLSSVRPMELLFGKILGKGLAGLLQYAIWIGVALFLSYVLGPSIGIELPSQLNARNLFFLVLFFILAFFLYSSTYAAIGAGSEDEQHMSQLAWPLIVFLVIPLVLISAFIMSPNSVFSQVLSYIPFTAPIVMLIRVILASPPAWQIILSVGILLASIIALVALSSKIFRIGLLMTGKRFSFGEIIKWLKY